MHTLDELPADQRNAIKDLMLKVAKEQLACLQLDEAIRYARRHGTSWGWIAACLQVSRQAAWAKYHLQDEPLEDTDEPEA